MATFQPYEDDAIREDAAPESTTDNTTEALAKPQKPKAERPKRTRKSTGSAKPENIVRLSPATNSGSDGREHESDNGLRELEAQGFSTDEASRIVYLTERLADSREARDAEATLRRLRFTRWLVEHGVLDEWTA